MASPTAGSTTARRCSTCCGERGARRSAAGRHPQRPRAPQPHLAPAVALAHDQRDLAATRTAQHEAGAAVEAVLADRVALAARAAAPDRRGHLGPVEDLG